jgi:hypothetical protein
VGLLAVLRFDARSSQAIGHLILKKKKKEEEEEEEAANERTVPGSEMYIPYYAS